MDADWQTRIGKGRMYCPLLLPMPKTETRCSDYDFGLPSFPWVNGRDFAGIVVKASKENDRIKAGDVVRFRASDLDQRNADQTDKVFGPSTDYRDVRKAAYQEYLVTTDFNVARLPADLPVNIGAAIGVAFVSALLALGVSLGFDFASITGASEGPDLLRILRKLGRDEIPEDIQGECLDGIKDEERPQKGDWFAIWGGKSTSVVTVSVLMRQHHRTLDRLPFSLPS